jgi:hypothetical protein
MNIYVRKTGGRMLPRVEFAPVHNIGYCLEFGRGGPVPPRSVPSLSFHGDDPKTGTRYTITISDADLTALNAARERHKDQFPCT